MNPLFRPGQPIRDYGVIGNLRSVALVGLDGSIDWCCFPNLDDVSVFAALLDGRRGGHFLVQPKDLRRREQRYFEDTNVLQTTLESDTGQLVITDFMPVSGDLDGCGGSRAEPEIHRLLKCSRGKIEVVVQWCPRFDFARAATAMHRDGADFVACFNEHCLRLAGLPTGPDHGVEVAQTNFGPTLVASLSMSAGEKHVLVTRWGDEALEIKPEHSYLRLNETVRAWRAWVHKPEATGERSWAGEYSEQVIRSELALKILDHGETGALAAAATTSLPEAIGGVRNWDYRFSWIRDAAQVTQAFFALGHAKEARAFIQWAERKSQECAKEGKPLHIMYGLRDASRLEEKKLLHLQGYRNSRPVRIGNEAIHQVQLDIYGELFNAAYERLRMGDELEPQVIALLEVAAQQAATSWNEPDYGIWELRNGPFHTVYSKVMICVALKRALWMATRGIIAGDTDLWQRRYQKLREEILARGFDPKLNSFVQRYGSSELDASNLLIPLMEFLPFEDSRIQGTINRVMDELTENDFVYRYRFDDGLPGKEGAFVLCTFWLVDALALSGRVEEAYRVFENMAGQTNHLGLLSEQIDPTSRDFLGNFPQAYSHVGLINSALHLAYQEGRETPVSPPMGSEEHRRQAAGRQGLAP